MIPAFLRQLRNEDYFLKRELPPTAKPYREEFHSRCPGSCCRIGTPANNSINGGKTMSGNWVEVCAADEIDEEDVIRFDHDGQHLCRLSAAPTMNIFATDGLCTHEHIHLADGLVMDDIIECPKHNGRFNYKTGRGQGRPRLRQPEDLPGQGRGRQRFHRRSPKRAQGVQRDIGRGT